MYGIYFSGSFKKDIKRCEKRRLDMGSLKKVVHILEKSGKLPAKYKPHELKGRYNGFWSAI